MNEYFITEETIYTVPCNSTFLSSGTHSYPQSLYILINLMMLIV